MSGGSDHSTPLRGMTKLTAILFCLEYATDFLDCIDCAHTSIELSIISKQAKSCHTSSSALVQRQDVHGSLGDDDANSRDGQQIHTSPEQERLRRRDLETLSPFVIRLHRHS